MSKIDFCLNPRVWETIEDKKICLVQHFSNGKLFCLVVKKSSSYEYILQALENSESFFYAAVFQAENGQLRAARFGFSTLGYLRYKRHVVTYKSEEKLENVAFWFVLRETPHNFLSWATVSVFNCHGLHSKHKILSLVTDKSDCDFFLVDAKTKQEFLLHKFIFVRNCRDFCEGISNFQGKDFDRLLLPEVENLEPKTVDFFINFLYFGTFSVQQTLYDISALEYLHLFILGDYFKIDSLKDTQALVYYQLLDGKFLPKNRQETNEQLTVISEFVEFSTLFDLHPQLLEVIFMYLSVFMNSIQKTESWEQFKNSFYDKLLANAKGDYDQKIQWFWWKFPAFSWQKALEQGEN